MIEEEVQEALGIAKIICCQIAVSVFILKPIN